MDDVKVLHDEKVRDAHAQGHLAGDGTRAGIAGVGLRQKTFGQLRHRGGFGLCKHPVALVNSQALHLLGVALTLRRLSGCSGRNRCRHLGVLGDSRILVEHFSRRLVHFFRHGEFPPR